MDVTESFSLAVPHQQTPAADCEQISIWAEGHGPYWPVLMIDRAAKRACICAMTIPQVHDHAQLVSGIAGNVTQGDRETIRAYGGGAIIINPPGLHGFDH